MSDNPFDVFAADLKAAVPASEEPAGNGPPQQPINIMAAPAAAPVPVMKQPVMNAATPAPAPMQQQQMGMGMNGMGMMGAGPAPPMNGGFGQPPAMGMGVPTPPAPMGMNGMGMGMTMGGAPPPAPTPFGAPAAPAPNSMVPSATQPNPYALSAPAPAPAGVPAPAAPLAADPFGAPPAAPAPVPVAAAPLPPAPVPAQPAPPAPFAADPFGAPPMGLGGPPAGMPPAPPVAADPWAQPAPGPTPALGGGFPPGPAPAQPNAIVPVPNAASADDPFGVFATGPAPAGPPPAMDPNDVLSVATPANDNQLSQGQVLAAADGGDPWADMGFGSPTPAQAPAPAPTEPAVVSRDAGGLLGDGALVPQGEGGGGGHQEGELPPGGEWYDARIFTPTLGVMFFKPQELTDSLFLQTDRNLVNALDDRPVVAFIVEGSSARAAGVELGHVLLKVNGIDVKNPKEASRLIKEGPRPLPLLFYVPDTTVVVAEGEHMVKYDTRETGAPNSAKDWKPKYVVIGGIIAQPWMMNMYRSKSEYDIAVIETQARRPVSVKVKQFSLQGARIQNDWQGPQMVKYKNKLHPWKYIVVLPVSRNPIKISSPNLAQLKPVHEGIRRVLMAQQRLNPNQQRPHTSQGRSDPYASGGQQQHYGGPPPQQYGGPPPQQYGGPPPQQYGGPPPQQQHYSQPPPGQYGGGDQSYSNAGGVGSARRRQEY